MQTATPGERWASQLVYEPMVSQTGDGPHIRSWDWVSRADLAPDPLKIPSDYGSTRSLQNLDTF